VSSQEGTHPSARSARQWRRAAKLGLARMNLAALTTRLQGARRHRG
jgi:hypothetical protein